MDLKAHSASATKAATHVEVSVERVGVTALQLHYVVHGNIDDIAFPQPVNSDRTDGLWNYTCFELFIRTPHAKDYLEFNFSPSGQWAAYRFDSYRTNMADLAIATPDIAALRSADSYQLRVTLDLAGVVDAGALQLGLSAIIEDKLNAKAWWALAHPADVPDFHHPDSFAYTV